MTQQTEEIDIESAKEQLREDYKEETGEEFPDHVVENYDDLVVAAPSTEDLREALKYGRKVERADSGEIYSKKQIGTIAIVMGVVGAVAGAAIVGSIVATFGTVIATVVGIMFGFAVGVVAR